jgi:hypothetical protein
MNMKKLKYLIIVIIPFVLGCKKLIEVGTPQNQLTSDKIFSDTTAATAAMANVYTTYEKSIDPNYNKWMSIYTDELISANSSSDDAEFNSSKLTANNGIILNFWSQNYSAIYSCNQIIEQLQNTKKLPVPLAISLTGEAKFLRAFSNFYLVNSFGPIPLILTTDVDQTAKAPRSDTATVYNQIVKDLQDAQNSLSATYIGTGKVRANKFAATALLARVYLYQRKWAEAETQSSLVINSGLYHLSSLSSVFQANSDETVLAFWTQDGYISDAPTLIPSSGPPNYLATANLESSFESGDQRKGSWLQATIANGTNYYYPFKYQNNNTNTGAPEYLVALRLAELYLIRAEARAEQGNISGAVQDLNVIRQRAGLPALSTSIGQTNCLNAAMQEWRAEFFMEWGHRFLELKRTGRINGVMSAYRSTWLSRAVSLPIPQNELTYDPFLTQNSGY